MLVEGAVTVSAEQGHKVMSGVTTTTTTPGWEHHIGSRFPICFVDIISMKISVI